MESEEIRQRQQQEILETAASLTVSRAAPPGSRPRPGEIYLCRKAADFSVEWLVLANAGNRLRVVPVDDYPLVGSHDVDLSRAVDRGQAVARCGLASWIPAAMIEPELRTQVLPTVDLEQVQERWEAVESGILVPSLREEVADGDPDYQKWVGATLPLAVESLRGRKPTSEPGSRVRWTRHVGVGLALAAMLLLVIGLALFAFEQRRVSESAKARVAALERTQQEQADLLAAEVELLEQLRREKGTLETELSHSASSVQQLHELLARREADLKGARAQIAQVAAGIVANIPKLMLDNSSQYVRGTGGETAILSQNGAPLVLLEIEIVDPEPYPSYNLRFSSPEADKTFKLEGLYADGAWLRLAIQPGKLKQGEYQLIVEGSKSGSTVELEDRHFLLVVP